MKKMLVTGGTVFVSKFLAEYFARKDFEVFVLNRTPRAKPESTKLIQAEEYLLSVKKGAVTRRDFIEYMDEEFAE